MNRLQGSDSHFLQCGKYRGHRIYDSGALRIQSDTVIERKPSAAASREIISPLHQTPSTALKCRASVPSFLQGRFDRKARRNTQQLSYLGLEKILTAFAAVSKRNRGMSVRSLP
jgi:hypothetical protein